MSAELFRSLLQITAAQILRAVGFDRAKPATIEVLTDLFARYIQLLGTTSRELATHDNHEEIGLEDARAAMERIGFLRPLKIFGDEDERLHDSTGVDTFIAWARGNKALEIRRVAGMSSDAQELLGVGAESGGEWFSSLMNKQIRIGAENPFRGTILDKYESAEETVIVEGGPPPEKLQTSTSDSR